MRKRKPDFKFNFGDVVSVGGYEGRAFHIDGYRHEECYYPGVVTTELIYELTNVQTLDWLEADEEDLTLLAPCDQADEYIAKLPKLAPNSRGDDIMAMFFGLPSEEPKGPRKPTQRELSAKEVAEKRKAAKERAANIDALLDEYNDTKILVEMFPEDNEYKARVEYLTLKLAEVSTEK